MPKVSAQGKTVECEVGANLRQVLLKNGIDLYNGGATVVNCHAMGTCGTCSVQIQGAVSEMSWREKARLSFPPHNPANDRRLACQVKVFGDIRIVKYDGFWGQGEQIQWTPEG